MGVHASDASSFVIHVIRCAIEDQNNDCAVGRRYFRTESRTRLYKPGNEEVVRTLLELEPAQPNGQITRLGLHHVPRRDRATFLESSTLCSHGLKSVPEKARSAAARSEKSSIFTIRPSGIVSRL